MRCAGKIRASLQEGISMRLSSAIELRNLMANPSCAGIIDLDAPEGLFQCDNDGNVEMNVCFG